MLHMLHTYFKYFICFRRMLYSVSCFRGVFRESWAPRDRAQRAGCRRSWCMARLGPAGDVLVLVWLPDPVRMEREKRGRWEGVMWAQRQGRVCVRRQTEVGYADACVRLDVRALATPFIFWRVRVYKVEMFQHKEWQLFKINSVCSVHLSKLLTDKNEKKLVCFFSWATLRINLQSNCFFSLCPIYICIFSWKKGIDIFILMLSCEVQFYSRIFNGRLVLKFYFKA